MAVNKTGGDIDAHCNKCKLELAHVVIAMNGTKVVRVECKTCRSVHAYKSKAAASKAASGTRAAAKRAPRASRAGGVSPADYERVMKGQDLSRAQRYRATVNYAEGDVVDHVTFGLGMVMRVLGDGKVEVLFPPGMKVLVHARGEVA